MYCVVVCVIVGAGEEPWGGEAERWPWLAGKSSGLGIRSKPFCHVDKKSEANSKKRRWGGNTPSMHSLMPV